MAHKSRGSSQVRPSNRTESRFHGSTHNNTPDTLDRACLQFFFPLRTDRDVDNTPALTAMAYLLYWSSPKVLAIFLLVSCSLIGPSRCQDDVQPVSGDVNVGAIFTMNNLEYGDCGSYDVSSLQQVVAVTWFLDRLNEIDFVPGVKIGLDVFRSCGLPEKAVQSADILLNRYVKTEQGCEESNSTLIGILGPMRTAEAMSVSRFLSSLPASQHVLLLSGSATGRQLSDSSLYPNFFRVIPPDSIQVQVMLDLLEALDWNYVAIVYDDDDYGRSAATELQRLAQDRQICVPVFESMPLDTRSKEFTDRIDVIIEKLRSREVGVIRGAVILASRRTTQHLVNSLAKQFSYIHFVLSEAIALQPSALLTISGHVISIARGALVTSPQYRDLPELRHLWNAVWTDRGVFLEHASRNAWLADFFKELSKCEVQTTSCWESAEDVRMNLQLTDRHPGSGVNLFLWYNIKAVATMAAILKKMHAEKCGPGHRGFCQALSDVIKDRQEILDILRTSSVPLVGLENVTSAFENLTEIGFDVTGYVAKQAGHPQYTVYNFRKEGGDFTFKQVGTFSNNTLSVVVDEVQFYDENGAALTWNQLPSAQCDVNYDCLQCEHDVSSDVIFMEGDFYMVALVPVHSKDPDNGLRCGDIQTVTGADLAEAVVFAVKQVNAEKAPIPEVLPGRKVGLLVIDTCSSPLLVRQRLLDLHSGRLTLPDGRNTSFLIPKIMGYVGAYNSGNSVSVADILNLVGQSFLQVSAASTSQELSDRDKYPFFMRLSGADDAQARVLLDVVVRLGANYIQVLYDSSTTYATTFLKSIESQIALGHHNVCVAQAVASTPRQDSSQYQWIVDKLRTTSSAKIVIVIMHLVEIEKMLDAVLPLLKPSDGFVFLASNSWGRRLEILEGRPKLAGSLVLHQELKLDDAFQQHFVSLDPVISENPWLKYFWEKRENCYFSKSFQRKGKSGPCPNDIAQNYVQDPRAPFHIDAVYALVLGFHTALTDQCGAKATAKCQALTSERLVEATKQVKLDLYGTNKTNEVFDSIGNGLARYKVLQITKDLDTAGDTVMYSEVGVWDRGQLDLKQEDLKFPSGSLIKSVCPNQLECDRCFPDRSPPDVSASSGVPVGVAAGVGALLIVIIIALAIFIIVYILRRRLKQDSTTNHAGYPMPTKDPEPHQWPRRIMSPSLPPVPTDSAVTWARSDDQNLQDLQSGDGQEVEEPPYNDLVEDNCKYPYLTAC